MLTPLLRRFSDACPDLTLDLILSDATLDFVEHRIDLAIRLGPTVAGDVVRSKLRDTRYRVCASPAYLDGAPPIREPSDLAGHEALRFGLDAYRTRWMFRDKNDGSTKSQ